MTVAVHERIGINLSLASKRQFFLISGYFTARVGSRYLSAAVKSRGC